MWPLRYLGIATALGARGYRKCTVPVLKALRRRQNKVGQFWPQRSAYLEWDFDREINMFCKRFALRPRAAFKDCFVTQNYVDHESEQRKNLGLEALSLTSNKALAEEGMQKLREILSAQISECYPKLPEQGVRAIRDHLLSKESLVDIATQMGLQPLVVRSGDGQEVDPELVMDTLLAIFAGIENQSEFCKLYVLIQLAGKEVFDIWHPVEASLLLNTILKERNQPPYEPRLIAGAGANTIESVFYVAVYSEKKLLGKGAGETQPAAIDMAVRDALKRIFGVTRATRSPFEIMALKRFRELNAGLTS